jgi:hypothetical protein
MKVTKKDKLETVLFSELPKKTKFKLGVYSEGMFFYYSNYKNLSFELGFFADKDCSELFPIEKIETILEIIDYKKYFSLSKFNKSLKTGDKALIQECKF